MVLSPPRVGVVDDARTADIVQAVSWALSGSRSVQLLGDASAIKEAVRDRALELLLVATTARGLASITSQLQQPAPDPRQFPIVLYLAGANESISSSQVSAFDDFVIDPLNPLDLRIRLLRLLGARLNDIEEPPEQALYSDLALRQFVGSSPSFAAAIGKVPVVAACDVPVLITGESGTGKEMCARAIHYLSARRDGPFVPVNCGSIPTELFENEFFGHDAGAFTDAHRQHVGLIAEAEGGTLLLDEVDALTPLAQVKLLRFLQDRQYRPLGASGYRRADTRLVAATNADLDANVRAGGFREDLLYRLRVVSIHLPPLRERREDIVPLADHFLKTAAADYSRNVQGLSPGAARKLRGHHWRGNARELENVIRQAVVLTRSRLVQPEDIPALGDADQPGVSSFKAAKAQVVNDFERNYLQNLLAGCGGNISQAARAARKHRRAFFSLLKKHGLIPRRVID